MSNTMKNKKSGEKVNLNDYTSNSPNFLNFKKQTAFKELSNIKKVNEGIFFSAKEYTEAQVRNLNSLLNRHFKPEKVYSCKKIKENNAFIGLTIFLKEINK